jgi:hypothetical protein
MIKSALALACGKMIEAGFTSVCDVLEAPNSLPGVLAVEAEVLKDAGTPSLGYSLWKQRF